MPHASRRQLRWARSLWKLVADKTEGRNDALNYAAFMFRGLIKNAAISAREACCILLSACEHNGYLAKDGPEQVKATIMSGLGIKERDYPTQKEFELRKKLKSPWPILSLMKVNLK
jgi:hypothetical protein